MKCKGCTDRFPGCHDKCADYLSWKAEKDRLVEEERKKREADACLAMSTKKTMRKLRRG